MPELFRALEQDKSVGYCNFFWYVGKRRVFAISDKHPLIVLELKHGFPPWMTDPHMANVHLAEIHSVSALVIRTPITEGQLSVPVTHPDSPQSVVVAPSLGLWVTSSSTQVVTLSFNFNFGGFDDTSKERVVLQLLVDHGISFEVVLFRKKSVELIPQFTSGVRI